MASTSAGALCTRYSWSTSFPLVKKVIDQTERRVLRGESVPATEKLVSIFEPHTDIIRKAPDADNSTTATRSPISTGRSGMVLDLVIEENGNPADSTLAVRSAERHAALFGATARACAAFDGGFCVKGQSCKRSSQAERAEARSLLKPAGLPIDGR